MVTVNLPKFGKIKTNGVWCDFHESNVITGTISDDYCKIKIEEFKPKMNTYKIISGEAHPTLERLMASQSEVKSESLREACCKFMKTQLGYEFFGYILHVETLNLFYVQYFRELDGREYFREYHKGKLEKPKMKKYKIIPNQNKHPDSITYEFMMDHFTVESDSPINAFRNYCEHDTFGLNLDSTFGYVLDVESLDLYYTSWSVNEQIGHSSFVMKLENPIEKPKMNKYKLSCKHTHIQDSSVVIEARHPSEAVIKYCEQFQYMNIHMYAMNIETLVVFEIFWKKDINGKVTTWTVQTDYIPEIKTKPMNSLSFKTLTEANNKRLPLFKNSKGLPAHSTPDGSDWSHAEWLQAVIGELGEYANIMKKVQRGDLTMEEAKFNEVSDRVDADVYIKNDVVYSKNNSLISKKEKLKVIKLIRVKSLLTNNVRYFYNSSSNFKNELQSVPKSILLNHKPYEYSPDCIKVNDLLQFIFDDYSTLSYVVTEITYEEDCVSKYESVNKEKEPLQKLMDKHKVRPDAWINNQDYATNAMIVGLVQILSPLFIKKPNQKLITLQDLNNGKVYTRPFTSGLDSITLQEFSKLIVNDATVMKTLQNGKDYEGFNVNVGDMIQFSDDRNVLYSLRVTKIE